MSERTGCPVRSLPLAVAAAAVTGMVSTVMAGGPPANDICANAEVVSGFDVTLSFDTTNADTDGPDDPSNPCGSASNDSQIWKDVWYRFDVPGGAQANSVLTVSNCNTAMFDSKIIAYDITGGDACGGDLIPLTVDCNEDCPEDTMFATSSLSLNVEPGESYLIRLGGFSTLGDGTDAAFGPGTISFLVQDNDVMQAALLIMPGDTVTGDTSTALENDDPPICGFGAADSPGRWYRTIGDGTNYVAQTCGSSYDTRLSVICTACGPTCAAEEDFGEACSPNERVTFCTIEGAEYFILVHGDFDSGEFMLSLSNFGKGCDNAEPTCVIPPCPEPELFPEILNEGDVNIMGLLDSTQIPNGNVYAQGFQTSQTSIFDADLNFIKNVDNPSGDALSTGLAYDSVNNTIWWEDCDNSLLIEADFDGVPTGNTISISTGGNFVTGLEYDATTDTFWTVDITDDDVVQIDRSGTEVLRFDQTCLEIPGGVLGNGLDVLNGQLEVLVGAGAVPADTVIPVDPTQLDISCGNLGMTAVTNGPVTSLASVVATGENARIGDITRNRLNPDNMFVLARGNQKIYEIGPPPTDCEGDTNTDGVVDVQDLTAVILAWGSADPNADIDGNGIVDVQDLTAVILAWGPC